MDEAAGDARYEQLVRDLELDGVGEGLALGGEHVVEFFRLGDGAGEAVEDETRQSTCQHCSNIGVCWGVFQTHPFRHSLLLSS